jgi:hypothetical protein
MTEMEEISEMLDFSSTLVQLIAGEGFGTLTLDVL